MAKPEEKEFDRPGQLNKDNVNPNAKHTNPPPPASGEMLSINEPPGGLGKAADAPASDGPTPPKPDDDDDRPSRGRRGR